MSLFWIVEAVVGLCQPFIVFDHDGGAKLVVLLAGGLEPRVFLPVLGKRKGFEAVGWDVPRPILQCSSEETCPDFMAARLEETECTPAVEYDHYDVVTENH